MTTQLVVASVSAIAAGASALTAFFSYRTAKKVMHGNVLPILVGSYAFDAEFIQIENIGKGPALNIRAQPMNRHYVDIKEMASFEIEDNQPRTINPEESLKISFQRKGLKNDSFSRKVTNYSVAELGRIKELGIIYEDIYGKKWITKLKVVIDRYTGKYKIEMRKVKRYTTPYRVWDTLDSKRFKLMKPYRERQAEKRSKNTTNDLP